MWVSGPINLTDGATDGLMDMSREAARKLARSPNGDHALVLRDSTGTVQFTEAGSGSTTNFTSTADTTIATVSADDPNLVAFTQANATLSSGGTVAASATPFDLAISRNGVELTATTGATTTATLSASTTLTTPDNAPTWTITGNVDGGTVTVSHTVSREDRVI